MKRLVVVLTVLMLLAVCLPGAAWEAPVNAYDLLLGKGVALQKMLLTSDGEGLDLINMADESDDRGLTAILKDDAWSRHPDYDPRYLPGPPFATMRLVVRPEGDTREADEAACADWTIDIHCYKRKPEVLVEAKGVYAPISGLYSTDSGAFMVYVYGSIAYISEQWE